METPKTGGTEKRADYQRHLFSQIPLYTTRLIREGCFSFAERGQLNTPEAVAVLLQDYFRDKDREQFVVVLLDASHSAIGMYVASIGGLTASIVEPRQVFKAAVLANAASIIVAHHHPSGNPEPSAADLRITRQLVEAGDVMGVPVLDHIIVHDLGYTSLAERQLMR